MVPDRDVPVATEMKGEKKKCCVRSDQPNCRRTNANGPVLNSRRQQRATSLFVGALVMEWRSIEGTKIDMAIIAPDSAVARVFKNHFAAESN